MALIVLTGPTASGKSTAAQWLADSIDDTVVFHSAKIRRELGLTPGDGQEEYDFDLDDNEFIESVSQEVYGKMRSRVGSALDQYDNAIIDGSHRLQQQRLASYRVGLERSVPVVVLVCGCEDEQTIKRRLADRRERSDPLAEATEFSTYLSTIQDADPVMEDPPIENGEVGVIEYNSYRGSVSVVQQDAVETATLAEIQDSLEELIDSHDTK